MSDTPTKSGRGCLPIILIILAVAAIFAAVFGLGMAIYEENKPRPVNYLVYYHYKAASGADGFGNHAVRITGKWDEFTLNQTSEHIRTNVLRGVTQPVIIIGMTKVE